MRVNGTGPGRSGPGPFFLGLARILPGAVLVPMLAIGFFSAQVEPACAKEASARAGVVIKYEEGREDRVCVRFEGEGQQPQSEAISGIEALRKTGLPIVTKTDPKFGEMVCKIVDVGSDDCASSSGYWAYWHASASETWMTSEVGASTYRVVDRAVEGWVWTSLQEPFPPTNQPSSVRFEEICTQAATETKQPEQEPRKTSALPWIIIGLTVAALIIGTIISRRVGGGA